MLLSTILYLEESMFGIGGQNSSKPVAGEVVEVAIIANSLDGTLSIINTSIPAIVKTIDAIPDGKRVSFFRDPIQYIAQPIAEQQGGLNYVQDTDLSRDGTIVFVSRGWLADVVAINIQTNQILWRSHVPGIRADHMDISPDGKKLFVSAVIYGGNVVQVFDTTNGKGLGTIQTGPWPHDVHVSPDNRTVYIASLGDMQASINERNAGERAYRITIADADTLQVKRELYFPAGVRPFQITERKNAIYLQLSNSHNVYAYNFQTGILDQTLEMPIDEGVSESDWDFEAPHHGLALSKDNKQICIAGRASDYAAVATTEPLSIKYVTRIGDAPSWAALANEDETCVLANNRSDDVSLVSMKSGMEIARIPVGRAPKHITVGNIPSHVLAENK